MGLSKNMLKELNKQINEEMYSAYLYRAMAADFEAKNLNGFAQWLKAQAVEEDEHAGKFYDFINERGSAVEFEAIAKPKAKWKTPLEAFEDTYKHEQHITGRIHFLLELAQKEKDHATAQMLLWFVDEQVEEEASADAVVQKLKMVGSTSHGLYFLDREMAQRKAD